MGPLRLITEVGDKPFPGEEALLPNIGPTLAAGLLVGSRFEGKRFTGGVSFSRGGVAKQPTQVEKVFLGRRAFVDRGFAPLDNELLRRN